MARSTTTEAFRSGSSRNSFRLPGPRHLVVVHGETVVEAEQFFQHGGADERGGVPSLLLENARQRMRGGLQDEAAGVSHFVNVRILPGEDTGVGRRRQRRLRDRVLETGRRVARCASSAGVSMFG